MNKVLWVSKLLRVHGRTPVTELGLQLVNRLLCMDGRSVAVKWTDAVGRTAVGERIDVGEQTTIGGRTA